jgi:ATP-dependent helicase IRC3
MIPTLRQYQLDALDSILVGLSHGQHRQLIKMPTGTGKTVMFAEMLKHLTPWLATMDRGKGAQMMVIAHREELLDQAAEKIRTQNPGLMVAVEQGDRVASRYSDVIVASIQTLSAMKFRRLKRILAAAPDLRIVVVDEAHHSAAATYRTALAHMGFLPAADMTDKNEIEAVTHDDVEQMEAALLGWDQVARKDRLLVGVTATPNRTDAIGLGCVFQTISYSYALKAAIDDGYLVPIVPWVIETSANLDAVRTTAGEFNQKDLALAVNNAQRNELAVAAWLEHGDRQSTIAFTVDVAHAHDLANAFRTAGIRAEPVSGETPKDQRRQILKDYTDGKIEVITNCMVLTEGTDLPRTGCILHAKPTKSATLYEQMTGRGLRIFPNKTRCLVIDIVDIARRHSLQTAPVLYGLPPGLKTKGDELGKMEADLEALMKEKNLPSHLIEKLLAEGRLTLEQLRAKASTFDMWTVLPLGDFGVDRALDWLKIGGDRYRVQYPWGDGTEVLDVQKDMLGHFEVVQTIRPMNPAMPKRQRTLATGVESAGAAGAFAEAYVEQERRSVMKLKSKDATWKGRPASDKQMALLTRYKARFDPKTITMGEASKLIDLAKSRRV